MAYDIIIKNGTIVDGTLNEPFVGDVAISDGQIASVGKVEGKAVREIDATDQVVTPGFVDIHTHLDAQMGWDPDMTPVSWHGVTTALIGNCGMTFAPCKPEDRELLAGMMETVEDIPKQAILDGLAWDWENYGEYLNSIERLGTAVNVAGLVGHAAVRYYVMGERSYADAATEDEVRQMVEIVNRSIDDGAWGFSTNRFEPHVAPDGRSIPGTFAPVEELQQIAAAVGGKAGLMQAVGADFDILGAVADSARERVLFSYALEIYDDGAPIAMEETQVPAAGSGKRAADSLAALCEGRDITAIAHVRGSGFLIGLQANLPCQGETWDALAAMDVEARLAAVEDAGFRAKLVAESDQQEPGLIRPERIFYLGAEASPDYTSTISLADEARASNEHWIDSFLRIGLETEGRALFNVRLFSGSIDEQAAFFENRRVYPGLGDAGAHVSQIMDAGWSTFMLSYWFRDQGFYTLPEVVERMTSGPARVVGLKDRGLLRPGMRADINVFDANEVAELQPQLVHDFPGGAPRFIQRARGFKSTIVNGQVSVENGELTGTRAGLVLRHGS